MFIAGAIYRHDLSPAGARHISLLKELRFSITIVCYKHSAPNGARII